MYFEACKTTSELTDEEKKHRNVSKKAKSKMTPAKRTMVEAVEGKWASYGDEELALLLTMHTLVNFRHSLMLARLTLATRADLVPSPFSSSFSSSLSSPGECDVHSPAPGRSLFRQSVPLFVPTALPFLDPFLTLRFHLPLPHPVPTARLANRTTQLSTSLDLAPRIVLTPNFPTNPSSSTSLPNRTLLLMGCPPTHPWPTILGRWRETPLHGTPPRLH